MTLFVGVLATQPHGSQGTSRKPKVMIPQGIRDTLDGMTLSVMMITYNHEQFIAQALESVLAQDEF